MHRDIFRNHLTLLLFPIIAVMLVVAPTTTFAFADKVVFSTESQVVKPGEISAVITIQTQSVSGEVDKSTETIDMEFTSSSASGEFLGSTGNPVSKTMSKGTFNRSFYYRDSVEGQFTLGVKLSGRESGKALQTSQTIQISSTIPAKDPEKEPVKSTSSSSTSQSTTKSSGAPASGPSTKETSSSATQSTTFEISIGKDRSVLVGVPVALEVEVKKGSPNVGFVYTWNLGDGTSETGNLVSHIYRNSGDYIVVVRGQNGDLDSTARVKIKVLDPKVSIVIGRGYSEVANLGNSEINLEGWRMAVMGGSIAFTFPKDSIILPGAHIKFPHVITKIVVGDHSMPILYNPMGEIVTTVPIEQATATTKATAKVEKKVASKRLPATSGATKKKVATVHSGSGTGVSTTRPTTTKVENASSSKLLSTSSGQATVMVGQSLTHRSIVSRTLSFVYNLLYGR